MPLEKLSESVRSKKDLVDGSGSSGQVPKTVDNMPIVPHRVLYAGIPFYSDKECSKEVPETWIYVLQPLEPDGFNEVDVVPSRKQYKVGQYLTWRLNKDVLWEDSYFRNPDTGLVEQAWTIHVEFVGHIISEKALAQDHGRIKKLETAYSTKQSPETVM